MPPRSRVPAPTIYSVETCTPVLLLWFDQGQTRRGCRMLQTAGITTVSGDLERRHLAPANPDGLCVSKIVLPLSAVSPTGVAY